MIKSWLIKNQTYDFTAYINVRETQSLAEAYNKGPRFLLIAFSVADNMMQMIRLRIKISIIG